MILDIFVFTLFEWFPTLFITIIKKKNLILNIPNGRTWHETSYTQEKKSKNLKSKIRFLQHFSK